MGRWLKPDTTKKMKLKDKAWLAGFFDGEGSISIWIDKRGYGRWTLSISNTHLTSLKFCKSITGVGSIAEKFYKRRKKNWSRQWMWQIKSQLNIISILKQMLPFLKVKKGRTKKILSKWKKWESWVVR